MASFSFLWLSTVILSAVGPPSITDVFISGTEGYHTYRIPTIVVSTNGTVLAFCEGRKNTRSDTGKIDLVLKRSTDGGKTWSAQQIVRSDGDNVCGNPAPVVDETTGMVWLLMTWNLGADGEREINNGASKDTRRVFLTHSADDGVTWAKPQEITGSVKKADWRWYATGPANGIQLTRGTWRVSKIIHAGSSAYSCLAVLPDKTIACLFECGEKSAYEKISLARIPLDWLEKE